ncbi:hypothetical protein [Desulfovibrio sp. 86]|uniref:tRNA (guanine(46)-N(7))-methyltransferase n=1 Tax=uncultured Desulfovibrio sp. TaxID=167968 RepID=A0A212L5G4_9BACT|nr:hypothetical protein [Desulfovibrio sp. 86]SCM72768.1 conserved hypothetical protein [uncultured Desulfovibrio sp.]VZH33727.1 conserved protein of unknown function [Desulfovibrio sp. 86]
MQEPLSQHIIEARQRFPRGLEQPEGSLRFGADALLLAAFAARHLPPEKPGPDKREPDKREPDKHPEKPRPDAANPGPTLVAELGCGCGAALLGLAMMRPHVCGLGLEREQPLVKAAEGNAARLGLSNHLHFVELDLADGAALSALCVPAQLSDTMEPRAASPSRHKAGMEQHRGVIQPASNKLDAVLANPPYDRGGRSSPRHMRERALRTSTDADSRTSALDTFCRAAATLLRHQGRFFCIYDAQALPRLCVALNAVRLGVRRILPVQSHRGGPALRVLVEARKNAAHDTVLETPLILHDAPETNAPKTSAPGTNVAEINVLGDNAPCSFEPRSNALCDSKPCGSRPCAGGPLWSAAALTFCPWLGVADADHTAAAVSPSTADNAFHRTKTKSRV